MRIGVDDDALTVGAAAVDRAAAIVVALHLDELATAIAAAMPGSHSAEVAVELVAGYSAATAGLAGDLIHHADALRLASLGYAETEGDIAASERRQRGAA
jgi:hypothetical protein